MGHQNDGNEEGSDAHMAAQNQSSSNAVSNAQENVAGAGDGNDQHSNNSDANVDNAEEDIKTELNNGGASQYLASNLVMGVNRIPGTNVNQKCNFDSHV